MILKKSVPIFGKCEFVCVFMGEVIIILLESFRSSFLICLLNWQERTSFLTQFYAIISGGIFRVFFVLYQKVSLYLEISQASFFSVLISLRRHDRHAAWARGRATTRRGYTRPRRPRTLLSCPFKEIMLQSIIGSDSGFGIVVQHSQYEVLELQII